MCWALFHISWDTLRISESHPSHCSCRMSVRGHKRALLKGIRFEEGAEAQVIRTRRKVQNNYLDVPDRPLDSFLSSAVFVVARDLKLEAPFRKLNCVLWKQEGCHDLEHHGTGEFSVMDRRPDPFLLSVAFITSRSHFRHVGVYVAASKALESLSMVIFMTLKDSRKP